MVIFQYWLEILLKMMSIFSKERDNLESNNLYSTWNNEKFLEVLIQVGQNLMRIPLFTDFNILFLTRRARNMVSHGCFPCAKQPIFYREKRAWNMRRSVHETSNEACVKYAWRYRRACFAHCYIRFDRLHF